MRNFFPTLELALQKGRQAMDACIPTPQHFYSADLSGKPLDAGSIEMEGDCGGAYITGLNGTCELVKFFKKYGTRERSYDFTLPDGTYINKGVLKGYTLHYPTNKFYNGQSHERYKAFYIAYASVLKEAGVICGVRDYLT